MIKIAIASGKGGTGKTTVAVNLADFLANNKIFQNVILADLDVEEPNSGLFINGKILKTDEKFKYTPEWNKDNCNSCGLCERVCKFNAVLKLGKTIMILPELCHSCFACSELCPENALPMKKNRMGELKVIDAGIYTFIESRLDIGQEQAVPLIAQSIDLINEEYAEKDSNAIIIIDSPPGTSCPVIEVTKNCDFVILVTEPTPFGLHDLKLAVNTMREIGKEFGVVINRYGIGNDNVIEYCNENNIDIIARIPNMRKIAEIYSEGSLIYKLVPEFKKELTKVADYLINLERSCNL